MEVTTPEARDDAARRLAGLPAHVVAALDHLTPAERAGVQTALDLFTRRERTAEAIPGPDPLFVLWAAPEVRVIVRRSTPEAPVEVEDVVRPATLHTFAQAHAG